MKLARQIEAEWLDTLDANHAGARASRRDLRRINVAMGTLSIACAALARATAAAPPRSILELGAGDGSLMARLARRLVERWPAVEVTLLDRQDVIAPDALAAIRSAGWRVSVVTRDVLDWLAQPEAQRWDVAFANLFVHHFSGDALDALLSGIAARCGAFACCEPRRARLALAASRMLGALGAGAVTRHDAVASVRAGFEGRELSLRWPDAQHWQLAEYRAGLFTHCLVATQPPAGARRWPGAARRH